MQEEKITIESKNPSNIIPKEIKRKENEKEVTNVVSKNIPHDSDYRDGVSIAKRLRLNNNNNNISSEVLLSGV